MREPQISMGFVIFREGYESEIPRSIGHWEMAKKWVEKNGFMDEFRRIKNDPNFKIYDFDDFLTDFIGAIRMGTDDGKPYCYVPRGNNNEYKAYLKHFFYEKKVKIFGQWRRYKLFGDIAEEMENVGRVENVEYVPIYNQLLIADSNGRYHYNPNRHGD